jgi:hypothetical protein
MDENTYTLHVGMSNEDAYEAVQHTDDEQSPWQSDNDGWFPWGDPLGIAGSDNDTVHLQAINVTLEDAETLVSEWASRLVPTSGIIAVISDSAVWSERQDKVWKQ